CSVVVSTFVLSSLSLHDALPISRVGSAIVIVVWDGPDDGNDLCGCHLVVARTISGNGVGMNGSILLGDIKAVVGTKIQRSRVINAFAGKVSRGKTNSLRECFRKLESLQQGEGHAQNGTRNPPGGQRGHCRLG